MSNRRKATGAGRNWLNQALAPLDGAHIPGGCDDCDAYQVPQIIDQGIARIAIHHDDWCPTLRAMRQDAQ
jgi:hypothetical protein